MTDFHIYIGYRTVSTWSLRGWLPLRKAGVPFDETLVRYRVAAEKQKLLKISPTGKVPYLVHKRGGEEVHVWDSLAIAEYLAELFPARKLWPVDPVARAFARAISAEMHSGFRPLRENLGMALLESHPGVGHDGPGVADDIARIQAIWNEARGRWGEAHGGPYLFGHFTIADAMYAPVVTRFRTYAVPVDPVSRAYMDAILADPDFRAWEEQARKDPPPEPPTP
jgi:glutathione S-transferase